MKSLIILLIFTCALVGCGDDSASTSIDPRKMPLEYQLVFLSEGKLIQADDPAVVKAKRLLEKASALYGQPQKDIVDWAVRGNEVLEKNGIKESPLEVLEATVLANDGSLPMSGEYKTLVTTYLTTRVNGMTRAEAIVGLRDLFKVVASTNPKRKN